MKCGQLCGHFMSLSRPIGLGHITESIWFGLSALTKIPHYAWSFRYTQTVSRNPYCLRWTHTSTPHIFPCSPTHTTSILRMPPTSVRDGKAGASWIYHDVREGRVGCVARVFLWDGLDNLIREKDEECRWWLKFVRMDGDGPCSDITPNMRDMRSRFGYTTLCNIAWLIISV